MYYTPNKTCGEVTKGMPPVNILQFAAVYIHFRSVSAKIVIIRVFNTPTFFFIILGKLSILYYKTPGANPKIHSQIGGSAPKINIHTACKL